MVISKIPLNEVWTSVKKGKGIYLLVALICFVLSQWISADRLKYVLDTVSFNINRKLNYILYLIGMFYNFFIPGGIGGDAYKVYYLHKKNNWPIKKLTAASIVDRFLGVVAIGILMLSLAILEPYFKKTRYIFGLITTIIIGIFIAKWILIKFFPSFKKVFTKGLFQSLMVQLLQCLSIVFILKGISNEENYTIYLIVFLISSVLSIFSFAGVGVREMIFYQASLLFEFNPTIAVAVGLLFSVITAVISLFGIVFHFKKDWKNYSS